MVVELSSKYVVGPSLAWLDFYVYRCYHFQSKSFVAANHFLKTTKLSSFNNLKYTLCYNVALMMIILAQHKTFASFNSLYYSFFSNNVNLTPSTYQMTCHTLAALVLLFFRAFLFWLTLVFSI